MNLDFSKVTVEKLSKLFPVILEEHNPKWSEFYLKEKDFLQTIFGDKIIRINHIGSSSVDGLIAKPTIDILLEVSKDIDLYSITEILKAEGYIVNTPLGDIIMYLKGYTPAGFQGQAIHIHVRYSGDWGELYFRDYLISHTDIADEYAQLKISLKEQYTYDRDGYTEAKGEFVKKYTDKARQEFLNKYTLTI
jgi:GrpB-like predicted nucleotidyltransferase (UPF0157 family)